MSDIVSSVMGQAMDSYSADKINQTALSKSRAEPSKADYAAKEFEAVFIAQMLKPMFETVETDGPFGGGNAENIFRSMMVDEYGKIIAEQGGIGIADALKNQLIEMQSQVQEQSREGL